MTKQKSYLLLRSVRSVKKLDLRKLNVCLVSAVLL